MESEGPRGRPGHLGLQGARGGAGRGGGAGTRDGAGTGQRDRFIDLVRAVSIVVVVLGHWTMAALHGGSTTGEGWSGIRVDNILAFTPQLHPLTWLLQVMPLFFFAAGFTNALGLRRPGRVRAFLVGRVERVTRPTLVLIGVWLVLCTVLIAAGVDEGLVDAAGQNAAMILWFLAVYLVLALIAPLQVAVHRRLPWLLVSVLPLLAVLLDRTQNTSWAGLGFVNYLIVFGFAQELGMLYADGRLTRRPRWVWPLGAAAAVGLLVLLTAIGPYPVSMITVPGEQMSNMLPPSVCVILAGALQVCLLMWARPALSRWLEGEWTWLAVVVVNRSVMTIFLWHLTGFVVATAVLLGVGLPLPEPGTGLWWAHKLLWLLVAGIITAVLVRLLTFVEWLPSRAAVPPTTLAVPATVLVAAGMTMVASAGFAHPLQRGGVSLAGLTFAPAWGMVLVVVGLLLVWLVPARARGTLDEDRAVRVPR
ncbi:acyltransferase [Ornithinimicrobium ciconiae]|uniref:Acyltransferase n=1 Tax=Ornithinimicrobium ciconiae TaxID=2594265 RepID=A0A516G682_9MICO|nr:acyltransferase [Ornithinimicrobium ciconiae]QDO87015.1 acyltransferase [Ornithinimicrobium ciconiae]